MIIGIDASNIGSGGGVNHLQNIITSFLKLQEIDKIILIQNFKFDLKINNDKLKIIRNWYSRNTFLSFLFQIFFHDSIFRKNQCKIIFIPGGIYLGSFSPIVSLSQNILPFIPEESNRNKNTLFRIKLKLIRVFQIITFEKSNGVIFLHENAKNIIQKQIKTLNESVVIPHGIVNYGLSSKYKTVRKFLYVSDFFEYKHHKNLIKAFSILLKKGYNIQLDLVGRIDESLIDNRDICHGINLVGSKNHNEVLNFYRKADIFIFPSTCENLPIALLEAMSFGLPIISSNKEPMKSILNSKNIFFDSLNVDDMTEKIESIFQNNNLENLGEINLADSKKYNWEDCAQNTFDFLKKVI